jgi:hypothetical protein
VPNVHDKQSRRQPQRGGKGPQTSSWLQAHAASNGKRTKGKKKKKIEARTNELVGELLLNAVVALPDPVMMRTHLNTSPQRSGDGFVLRRL